MNESRRFEPAYFICLSLARLVYPRKEDYVQAAKAIYSDFEEYRSKHKSGDVFSEMKGDT